MLSKPKQQTINEITTLVAVEKQQAYEEGVRSVVLSVDRIMAWLNIEPFDWDTFRRWAKAEQDLLLRKHPFLGPVEGPGTILPALEAPRPEVCSHCPTTECSGCAEAN
jgi:hypothetical protein